jgi:hypothetical protein
MNQELKKNYRGVYCQCCRQPIPLPAIVIHIESESRENELNSLEEKTDRVFTLRCRACEKEMPYRISEGVDMEGSPRPRFSNRRNRAKLLDVQNPLSRAANA